MKERVRTHLQCKSGPAKWPSRFAERCEPDYFEVPVGAWLGVEESLLCVVPCGAPDTGAVFSAPPFVPVAAVPGVTASLVPARGFAAGPVGFWSAPLLMRSGFTSLPAAPPPACAIATVALPAINAAAKIVFMVFMSPLLLLQRLGCASGGQRSGPRCSSRFRGTRA